MLLDADICYRALRTRDARFDGRFFTAVTSTGIFCRPVCPAPTPKPVNCRFYPSAAAALEAGFRPCLRCRPELAPRVAGLDGRSPLVRRALAQIAEGALEEGSIETFAAGLGITERHLRRLFVAELGAPPLAIVHTQRLLLAKQLLDETALPITHVALASGFRSVRRFNDVIRATYGTTPSLLRKSRRASAATDDASSVTLKLPYAPPYNWPAMIGFLRARAIPGVEEVGDNVYRRTISLDGARGTVEVRPAASGPFLLATIRVTAMVALSGIVDRLRNLFDLGANVGEITEHFGRDAMLAPLVERFGALRVPGAWDRFELGVRAILGQQVSVAAATTMAARIVRDFGAPLDETADVTVTSGPHRLFPDPGHLADADLTTIGLTGSRAAAVNTFAAAARDDRDLLRDAVSLDDCAVQRLTRLRGIGPWTAQYIAMRALRQPDAFPSGDLVLRTVIERLGGPRHPDRITALAEGWRPWRAYAAMYLWMASSCVMNAE